MSLIAITTRACAQTGFSGWSFSCGGGLRYCIVEIRRAHPLSALSAILSFSFKGQVIAVAVQLHVISSSVSFAEGKGNSCFVLKSRGY